jgi:hypothetical protein
MRRVGSQETGAWTAEEGLLIPSEARDRLRVLPGHEN